MKISPEILVPTWLIVSTYCWLRGIFLVQGNKPLTIPRFLILSLYSFTLTPLVFLVSMLDDLVYFSKNRESIKNGIQMIKNHPFITICLVGALTTVIASGITSEWSAGYFIMIGIFSIIGSGIGFAIYEEQKTNKTKKS
jgi:low temperature requirement protein LtrA